MDYILQTNELTKRIRKNNIVDGVNITIKAGEIYGFLGSNGAGKTSVMKMLINFWKPTSGDIIMFGDKITSKSYEYLKRIGVMIEYPVFYDKLTGYENLSLQCKYLGYYKKGCVEEVLDQFGLKDDMNKKVKEYSLGMRQRLGIARALVCKPEFLILDEPTNGLDPSGIKYIRNLLKKQSLEYGTTIMISSHILSEIESIADTIGVINNGKLVTQISMKEIEQMNLSYTEIGVVDIKKASFLLADKFGITNFKAFDNEKIRIYDENISMKEVIKTFVLNDIEILEMNKKGENLEDYFIKLTSNDDI